MLKDDCLFCKMIKGEISCNKVYEDEKVLAFDDINPMSPVHVLIIPKAHYDNVGDDVPQDLLGCLLKTVKIVAEKKGILEKGYRVSINTGADGGQSVNHLHLHVNGGAKLYCGTMVDAEVKK